MNTETLKKMVYITIGYAATYPEKIREISKQLADNGKVSEKEGHALVDEMIAKLKSAETVVEEKIKKVTKTVVDRLNQTHSEKLMALGERITALEKKGIAKVNSIIEDIYGPGKTAKAKGKRKIADTVTKPVAQKKAAKKSFSKKSIASKK